MQKGRLTDMPHDSERHAQHDELLVVSLAAGDIAGADRDRATALITGCPDCARLHDDLVALARATAALPAAVRPRDFQLTPDDAARLRPGGWRRLAAAFASSRLLVSRQMGVGLTTIGLAGLLLSTLSSMSFGMGSAAASPAAVDRQPVAAPAASSAERGAAQGPSAAPSSQYMTDGSVAGSAAASSSASAAAAPSGSDTALGPVPGSTKATTGQGQGNQDAAQSPAGRNLASVPSEPAPSSVSLLPIVSALLVLAGLLLLVARRVARRIVAG